MKWIYKGPAQFFFFLKLKQPMFKNPESSLDQLQDSNVQLPLNRLATLVCVPAGLQSVPEDVGRAALCQLSLVSHEGRHLSF